MSEKGGGVLGGSRHDSFGGFDGVGASEKAPRPPLLIPQNKGRRGNRGGFDGFGGFGDPDKRGHSERGQTQKHANVMPKSPESEILVKFFPDMGEKCGENLAKNFADFRPSISRTFGRKKFHEKSSANSTSHEIEFFHSETLGACGHNK